MKIGLIDVDGMNFPNLALMKISAYHKLTGDEVEWATIGDYFIVYMSKVFSFTPEPNLKLINSEYTVKGGTGYNLDWLTDPIERTNPDYTIYPKFKEAYGFLTRGCPNKCDWCIVPEKEGEIGAYDDIENILQGRKSAVLLDNNVLSSKHGLEQLQKIAKLGIKVDFNQGLDARIIAENEGIAQLLGEIRWFKPLRMACNTKSQMKYIERAVKLLRKHNTTPRRYFVYVLCKSIPIALEIVEFLRDLNLDPFTQPYRSMDSNYIDPEQKHFARWVNHKATFKTVKYSDYKG